MVALAQSGCVSPPRPAGPVRIEGPVPGAGERATAGTLAGRVTQGPLLLRAGELTGMRHGTYAWSVELVNPGDGRFDVSLVVILLDGEARPVGTAVRDLVIGRHDRVTLSGTVAATSSATRFRLEYWVRVPAPPERRRDRPGT